MTRSALALLAGDVAAARAEADAALELAGAAQADGPALTHLVGLTMIGRDRGDLTGLEEALRNRIAHDTWNLMPHVLLAVVLAESGQLPEASRVLDDLLVDGPLGLTRDYLWLGQLGLLAEVAVRTAATEHATPLYDALRCASGRLLVLGATAPVGAADRALGLLSATLGDHERAMEQLSAALQLHERIGARQLVARTELDLAHVHEARGETGAAAAAQGRAERLSRELGVPVPRSPLDGVLPPR